MAKVVESKVDSRPVNLSNPVWLSLSIGAAIGLLFWLMTLYITRFTDSDTIPGDVATILAATIATVVMVRFRMIRPLLISLAAAVSLWGLAVWTKGLNGFEAVAWSVGLYALAYTLYAWLVRYIKLVPVLVAIIAVVIITRLSLLL